MKKSNLFLGFLVYVFAFGLLFTGCGGSDEPDTWSTVSSINQLNGTWHGSYSEKYAWKDLATGEENLFNGNVTVVVDYILTYNASAKTERLFMNQKISCSGGNISTAWPQIKAIMQQDGFSTFNDASYTGSSVFDETFTISDNKLTGYKINQNGKKMKCAYYRNEEVIFTKQ